MKDQLVPIYHAYTASDAQGLADRLRSAGVEAFVEMTEAPMYGMRAGPQSQVVYVRKAESEDVRSIVRTWEHEGHPGVPPDERESEATGLEIGPEDERTGDSPVEGVAETTERFNEERPGPDTPEIQAIHGDLDETDIESFGVDRDIEELADVERPEFEDQPIDSLTAETLLDESAGRGEPPPDVEDAEDERHGWADRSRRKQRRK